MPAAWESTAFQTRLKENKDMAHPRLKEHGIMHFTEVGM